MLKVSTRLRHAQEPLPQAVPPRLVAVGAGVPGVQQTRQAVLFVVAAGGVAAARGRVDKLPGMLHLVVVSASVRADKIGGRGTSILGVAFGVC